MNTLYIECKMGAAGDMLMAALYELTDKKEAFLEQMNTMFGDSVSILPQESRMCGISGTHMQVRVLGTQESPEESLPHTHGTDSHTHGTDSHGDGVAEHGHRSYREILSMIDALPLPKDVRGDAAAVYRIIGDAEAEVHGQALEHIHFHEVGSYDALADVVGCCLLFSYLHPDRVLASPVHVGNGTVRCAHGTLPVPAPATAEILKGIPFYTGEVQTELCTPTGAAILKHFVDAFTDMPAMLVSRTGTGFGTKQLPAANIVRIFSGEPFQTGRDGAGAGQRCAADGSDSILDLSCNLDDMTGEALGFAMEQLLSAGALDVFYIPVQMKKNRPGILLHCLCELPDKEKFTKLVFAHTTTRGIRYQQFERAKLTSAMHEVDTPCGTVRIKKSEGYGSHLQKMEYEDLRKMALEQGKSLREVAKDMGGGLL